MPKNLKHEIVDSSIIMFNRFSYVILLILLTSFSKTSLGHIFYEKEGVPENFFFGVSSGAKTANEMIADKA